MSNRSPGSVCGCWLRPNLCCFGKALSQRAGQVMPAGLDLSGFLLAEHRAQRRSDHALMGSGDALEQVAGKVHSAALPAAALQHPPDDVREALVGIADHQCPTTIWLRPRSFSEPMNWLQKLSDSLSPTLGVHAHGDDDGPGADLHRRAEPAVGVGGIEVQVGIALLLQRTVQKGLHLHVDVGAGAAHLGFRDPALAAQSRHQGIDLAGGDTADVSLHHDGIERLIHTPARLEDREQKAAATQLGDPQVDVPHLGGEQPGPVAVAVTKALLAAFVAIGAGNGGDLQLDQLLRP